MARTDRGRWGRAGAGAAGVLVMVGALLWGSTYPRDSQDAATSPAPTAATSDWRPGDWGGAQTYGGGGWYPGGSPSELGAGSTDTTSAQSLSAAAQQAAAEVTPSVVNIDTVVDYGSAEAAGTGIVLTSDGYVLTNHHVIEGATTVTATLAGDDRTYAATVVGYDASSDLAVIKLVDADGLTPADLGDSDDLAVGDLVVGVGNAGGDGGEPTSLEGTVTALDQTITATDALGQDAETLTGLIGTDAPIQSGQSGGPLVDADGEVVGVDVAASTARDGSSTGGYAIPIDHAEEVARQIIAGTSSSTVHIGGSAFLGIQVADGGTMRWAPGPGGWAGQGAPDSGVDDGGLLLQGVVDGSAADTAGLAAGDTLLTFDGQGVSTLDALGARIDAHAVGDQVSLTWTDSSGSEHTATVTLGEGPVGD